MSGETIIHIVGNLTGDPELRFLGNGHAVANFTVASTPRKYDKSKGEFVEGDPLFLRVVAWRELAENTVESLSKGQRVVVVGELKMRSYETREGEKRTVWEMEAAEVAPSLRFATAKVTKAGKREAPAQSGDDGWGSAGGGGSFSDEPPF